MSVFFGLVIFVIAAWFLYTKWIKRTHHYSVESLSNTSSDSSEIGLYTIYYSDAIGLPSVGFSVYDCRKQPHKEEREVFHMFDFHQKKMHLKHEVCALLSPEYSQKTHVTAHEIRDFIKKNPGFDLYLLDPFHITAYAYYNVWTQGERWHLGLIDVANELLRLSGYNLDVSTFPRQLPAVVNYCNYWAGTSQFWDTYINFLKPMVEVIKKDKKSGGVFYQTTRYNKKVGDFKFIPFVLERMLSTFLSLNPHIKVIRYPVNIEMDAATAEILEAIDRHDELQQYDNEFFQLQEKSRSFIK